MYVATSKIFCGIQPYVRRKRKGGEVNRLVEILISEKSPCHLWAFFLCSSNSSFVLKVCPQHVYSFFLAMHIIHHQDS